MRYFKEPKYDSYINVILNDWLYEERLIAPSLKKYANI